jgi:hypothetical protein
MIAEAMQKVGNEGVITVEEAKGARDRARRRRRHAVRPRLPLALLHHQRRQDEAELEDPYILLHEKKLSSCSRCCRCSKPWCSRAAAAHHRRGRRRRSAGHARRQQAARRPQGRRRQGAGLRRSPQGHAGRHRDPDRRPGDLRRPRHQARERHARHARPRQEGLDRQGQHHHRRRRRQEGRDRGPRAQIRRRSRRPPRTTTRRSCRSVWRSSPAALRSSASAARPKSK